MLFNSPIYIFLFLPITVIGYFILSRCRLSALSKFWLIAASLFFYGYRNPVYLLLIVGSILMNFFLGNLLSADSIKDAPKKLPLGISRRRLLILGIATNVSILLFYKYSNFFIDNVNMLLSSRIPLLKFALPLAVSFFTFQQIAYLCDSYFQTSKRSNLLNYSLFVLFFPQLIAGPINRSLHIMPQFQSDQNRFVNWDNIATGAALFSLGLFKKAFIADSLSIWADMGFRASETITLFDAWGASLSYTFQLYYDFSGYSDMATGAALFFNIRLPANFNSPYQSRSIQDFWRRWHITLSQWLRDYIYIPLGGSRVAEIGVHINLLITFLLGGFWHGASWTFVVWGAMHGVALCVHRLWKKTNIRMNQYSACLITFLFVNMSWIFFRAENMKIALNMLKGMLGFNRVFVSTQFAAAFHALVNGRLMELFGTDNVAILPIKTLLYIVLFGIAVFVLPNSLQLTDFLPYQGKWKFHPTIRFAFVYAMIAVSALYGMIMMTGNEFLYFRF